MSDLVWQKAYNYSVFIFQIKLDITEKDDYKYDDCNTLVLPAKKRKTKKIIANEGSKKILTKKMKMKLLKILEKKEKKNKVRLISFKKFFFSISSSLSSHANSTKFPDSLSPSIPIIHWSSKLYLVSAQNWYM